jgi:hypothetical protein
MQNERCAAAQSGTSFAATRHTAYGPAMRPARLVLLTSLVLLLAAPAAFADTLVDQTATSGTSSVISEVGASPTDYNGEAADDVTVPSGAQWTVNDVDLRGMNYGGRAAQPVIVRFYADAGGQPGAETYKQTTTIDTSDPNFTVALATPAVLTAGKHWLSVQVAGSDGTAASEWFWLRGATAGTPAQFRNSFASGLCSYWYPLATCQGAGGTDLRFVLFGTSGPPTTTTTPPTTGGGGTTTPVSGTVTPASPAPVTGKPVTFANLVTLPSAKACLSRRQISIKLAKVTGTTVTKTTVQVAGKTVRTVTGKALRAPVDLRGLPKGTFVVQLKLKLSDGRTLSGKRTYRTCAAKRKRAR